MSYAGLQTIINPHPRMIEDWSQCRSPSRAKRRHRQGHKTRMRFVEMDEAFIAAGKLVISAAMQSKLKARIDSEIMKAVVGDGVVGERVWLLPDEETAQFSIKTMKDMMAKYDIDHAPDIFSFDPYKPMKWPYDTTNRYARRLK